MCCCLLYGSAGHPFFLLSIFFFLALYVCLLTAIFFLFSGTLRDVVPFFSTFFDLNFSVFLMSFSEMSRNSKLKKKSLLSGQCVKDKHTFVQGVASWVSFKKKIYMIFFSLFGSI